MPRLDRLPPASRNNLLTFPAQVNDKALYLEGAMVTRPGAGGEEIARWFWGATAVGQLLRRVRDRLDASSDPAWKAAAFGVAR